MRVYWINFNVEVISDFSEAGRYCRNLVHHRNADSQTSVFVVIQGILSKGSGNTVLS